VTRAQPADIVSTMKHIHPFPARMAPELALAALKGIGSGSVVLDPMSGSGTVLRQASLAGHQAIGFDLDPLAVLISQVSSRAVDLETVEQLLSRVMTSARKLRLRDAALPWIDASDETREFVLYWFGPKQRHSLRKLAFILAEESTAPRNSNVRPELDVLKVALSRTIITKEVGASLARDVSHSRPHKVRDKNDYDVLSGFERSTQQVLKYLRGGMPVVSARSAHGDARKLTRVLDDSIDLIVTSPPYLNAIDYLRGHKLSLVWLGYSVENIRQIRSKSIGAERAPDQVPAHDVKEVARAMIREAHPSNRVQQMITRYAGDVYAMIAEMKRVLRTGGKAVLVVGDSCLQSTFVSNSAAIKKAAQMNGFRLEQQMTRELPTGRRYLPVTGTALSKRMRVENVLTFRLA